MKLKIIAIKLALLVYLASMLILIGGCGEKKAPVDPPSAEPDLVLELLDALSKKKHDTALNKIKRLKGLKKNSVFLAKLENLEQSNLCIVKAQKLLDNSQVNEALKVVNKGIDDYGRHEELTSTETDLKYIREIIALTDSLNNPSSSSKIIIDALKLKKIAETYKPASIFKPYINDKIALAYRMKKWEKQRAVFDLCSDINLILSSGKENADVFFAQLAIISPDSLHVKKWLENSSENKNNLIFIEE